jgi:hypothetical protein
MISSVSIDKNFKKFEIDFFEILLTLSKTTPLKLSIPETFICGFSSNSISLLSTNYETGDLLLNHEIPRQTFIDSIYFFEDLVKMKSKFPIAISKTKGISSRDVCKVLFSRKDCLETWNKLTSQSRGQILQRYIPSSWNVCLFRCTYEGNKGTCRKSLLRKTNKNVYEHPGMKKVVNFQNQLKMGQEIDDSSYIIKKMDQVSSSVVPMHPQIDLNMEGLIAIIEKFYGPSSKIINLQADWIQDPKGNLFLINVKKYSIRNELTSFVIDRPLQLKKARKQNYSYSDLIVRRTLSPPFYFKCNLS